VLVVLWVVFLMVFVDGWFCGGLYFSVLFLFFDRDCKVLLLLVGFVG